MRFISLTYLCLCLILLAVFLMLSYNAGFGYVYIQWLGWQLQSNLLLLLVVLFVGAAIFFLLWKLLQGGLQENWQRYRIPKSYEHLHPYEQLGILWLLKAEKKQHTLIFNTYAKSALINPLIRAKIFLKQNNITEAKAWLDQSQIPLFELAELLKVEIALIEKNYVVALERLEFLTVQPLSAWLQPVKEMYLTELREQWLQLSKICPWWLFKAFNQPKFNDEQNRIWLQSLLQQRDQADLIEQNLFIQWYATQQVLISNYDLEQLIVLLKLINQFEQLHHETYLLSQRILQRCFDPQVLYIWLDQVLNHAQLDILSIEQQVEHWQQQYPAQPSLSFAKWHIYHRQAKHAEAEALLAQYPEDPYMAYLRIQDVIQNMPSLQYDLKRILHYSKQDFKFDF